MTTQKYREHSKEDRGGQCNTSSMCLMDKMVETIRNLMDMWINIVFEGRVNMAFEKENSAA